MKGLAITAGQPEEPAGRRQERGQGQRAEPAVRRLPVARPAAVRQHELVQRAQLLRRPRRTSTPRRSTTSRSFFKTFYAPNNAVLVVVGDFDPAQTKAWIEKYFAPIPSSAAAAEGRHLRAAAGEGEARDQGRQARHAARARDRLPRAAAQHARVLRDGPARPDPRPGQGQPALPGARPEERPDRRGRAAASTPASATCSTSTGRRSGTSRSSTTRTRPPTQILKVFDAEIEKVQHDAGRPGHARPRARQAALAASTTRWSSSAASARPTCSPRFALFDDDPARINRIEAEFRKVTPALMQKTAQEYLRARQSHDPRDRSEGRPRRPRAGRRRRP